LAPLPANHAEYVLGDGLRAHLNDAHIEILNIVPVEHIMEAAPEKLKAALDEMGFKGTMPDSGVVFILFKKDDKKFLVLMAEKTRVSADNIPGIDWPVSGRYIVKYIPEDYAGQVEEAIITPEAKPAQQPAEPAVEAPVPSPAPDAIRPRSPAISHRNSLVTRILLAASAALTAKADVNLAWDPSPDTNVVGYAVYYATKSDFFKNGPEGMCFSSTQTVGNVTNYTVPRLVEGTTYYFAVTALSDQGLQSEFSNVLILTNTPPLLPPENFQIVSSDKQDVTFSWAAGNDDSVIGHTIYHGTSPGNFSDVMRVGKVTGATWKEILRTRGTHYFYIASSNSRGVASKLSSPVTRRVVGKLPTLVSPVAQVELLSYDWQDLPEEGLSVASAPIGTLVLDTASGPVITEILSFSINTVSNQATMLIALMSNADRPVVIDQIAISKSAVPGGPETSYSLIPIGAFTLNPGEGGIIKVDLGMPPEQKAFFRVKVAVNDGQDSAMKLYSFNPLMAGAALSAISLSLKSFVLAHPVMAGIAVLGIGIAALFAVRQARSSSRKDKISHPVAKGEEKSIRPAEILKPPSIETHDPVKASQLFELVESSLNDRRNEFIESGKNITNVDKRMPTTEIKDRVENAIRAIE
jgi:hypothetical protein